MISEDRIVSVTKTDLITLYGVILKAANVDVAKLDATATGTFKISSTLTTDYVLADEPVKSLDIASTVTSASIYFVAAYDFEGFTVGGASANIASASVDVEADGNTLYLAALADGEITVSKVGL